MKLLEIAKSWYDFITADNHTKSMMQSRLEICDKCPFKAQISPVGQQFLTTINSEANLFKCTKCGCPLAAKTARYDNKCPINKWGVGGSDSMY